MEKVGSRRRPGVGRCGGGRINGVAQARRDLVGRSRFRARWPRRDVGRRNQQGAARRRSFVGRLLPVRACESWCLPPVGSTSSTTSIFTTALTRTRSTIWTTIRRSTCFRTRCLSTLRFEGYIGHLTQEQLRDVTDLLGLIVEADFSLKLQFQTTAIQTQIAPGELSRKDDQSHE